MVIRSLRSWSREPGFAAAGLRWLTPDMGTLDGSLRIVVISGSARHLSTGQTLSSGMVAEYEAGESVDLEVTADMTYWTFEG